MGIFRKNGKFWIDYYDEARRRYRECIGTNRKAAEQALAIRKAEILQGRFNYKKDKGKDLLSDFAQTYLAEYSRVNKRSYERDISSVKALTKFFGNKKLNEIQPFDIERYKTQREKEVAKASINRELACLKHMYTMAIKWSKADTNPVKEVKFFKENNQSLRILTGGEEKRLLACASDHLKPIIIMAVNSGMRRNEILGLTWDKINFENKYIIVAHTKNNEYRIIPMNNYLESVLKRVKRDSQYVFCKPDGSSYGAIKTAFNNAVRRSGIAKCRFHDLRHTFASRLVMRGVDLVTVQQLMGHKTIKMTMRYSHPTPDHKRWAVEALTVAFDGHYMDTKANVEISHKS